MTAKEQKETIQEKLELIIERNKNEAGALKKIVKAIEEENKKSIQNHKKKIS